MLNKLIKSDIPSFNGKSFKSRDPVVHVHLFNPIGVGDWFIIALKKEQDDFICYGLISLDEPKLGNFNIKAICNMELPFGLKICWDKEFKPTRLSVVMNSLKSS